MMVIEDEALAESLVDGCVGSFEGKDGVDADESRGIEDGIGVRGAANSPKGALSNTLYWEYNDDYLFDVRLDELLPNVLFFASCVSTRVERGPKDDPHSPLDESRGDTHYSEYEAHSAFVSLNLETLEYDASAFSRTSPEATPLGHSETYISYITSNIFSRFSADIQMDEAALYDVSWEPEAQDLCRQLKEFLESPTEGTEHDLHVFNANGGGSIDVSMDDGIHAMDHSMPAHDEHSPGRYGCATRHVRILDGTCGIGGNLVHFADWFDFAVGVEISPSRAQMCRNNLSVYGVDTKAVVINDNFLEWAQRVIDDPAKEFMNMGIEHLYYPDQPPFDWTFISPPWGGRDYKGTRDSGVYYLHQGSKMDVFRALSLAGQLSTNVTLYLPRSQSVSELVKMASCNGFPFILITGYLTPGRSQHVRCGLVHFVKSLQCFSTGVAMSKIDHLGGARRLKTGVSVQQAILKDVLNYRIKDCSIAKSGIFQLVPVKDKAWKISSHCGLNFILYALMQILKETKTHFSTKLAILMKMCPLSYILRLVDSTLEVQFSGGMSKDPSPDGQCHRTTGGVFFNLLKRSSRDLYRRVEREYKC